ncbi:MAG TPA: hypothetical protein VEJ63_06760 [Planctomycetota bacterium]|nr:hypothetical protein [Planctomycetota bacterium]
MNSEELSLLGLWSVDVMYGPGAASDEVLLFFPDGSGRLDLFNWLWCGSDLFNWKVDQGILVLKGFRSVDSSEDAKSLVESTDLLNLSVAYSISVEQTKSGKEMRVLRTKTSLKPLISDHFGFVRESIEDQRNPDFLQRPSATA